MVTVTLMDIKLFAERVERLCAVLAEKMDHDDGRTEILKLKDDAANIATTASEGFKLNVMLDGVQIADALRRR